MLRISPIQIGPDEVCITLEGRLLYPWVEELLAAAAAARCSAQTVHLDLSALRFVDESGLAVFVELQQQGIQFRNASPFIQELLKTRRE